MRLMNQQPLRPAPAATQSPVPPYRRRAWRSRWRPARRLARPPRCSRFGGGTSFPGSVARRVDPHVLQKVAAASMPRTVVVTGSNGKTTTCRMLAALADAGGLQSRRTGPAPTCGRE